MYHTGVGECGRRTGVVQGFRRGRPTPPWTFGALHGAGALRSTVGDLLVFARACIEPPQGILGETLDLAGQTFHGGSGPSGGMGLGWMIRAQPRTRGGGAALWHDGGTYGSSSFLAVDPESAVAVVSLGNAGPRLIPPLDGPSWKLFDSLREQRRPGEG
jgi:CubicO group peptidase (beta-lactamase class C family)